MSDWDVLLRHLAEVPRENGSEALQATAMFLADQFRQLGVAVDLMPFQAQPYAGRLAGGLALCGGVLYALLLRRERYLAAFCLATTYTWLLCIHFLFSWPVIGLLAPAEQYNVAVHLPAVQPTRQLILTAHYDTITELVDHAQSAVINGAQVVAIPFVIGAAAFAWRAARAWRRQRWFRVLTAAAAVVAIVHGAAVFAEVGAGGLLTRRSNGALDNGAACAVLVRLGQSLAAGAPLQTTNVEIVFFSSEELGVLGSAAYARQLARTPDRLPTAVINLENIGASHHLGVFASEPFGFWRLTPDAGVVEAVNAEYQRQRREDIAIGEYPAMSDARSFLVRGIPALTLASYIPGELIRGLHSAQDQRDRLHEPALDSTVEFLHAMTRTFDALPASNDWPRVRADEP